MSDTNAESTPTAQNGIAALGIVLGIIGGIVLFVVLLSRYVAD